MFQTLQKILITHHVHTDLFFYIVEMKDSKIQKKNTVNLLSIVHGLLPAAHLSCLVKQTIDFLEPPMFICMRINPLRINMGYH
jgi:hypothetical protein